MNVDLDKYLRNFRIFYSKILTGHPQQTNLQKKFKFLIENQANKWRSSLFSSNTEEYTSNLRSFLSKAKSTVPKPTVKRQKQDWLFETSNFTRCFVFTCILSLLEIKSKEGIQMIRAHLENQGVLVDGKMFRGLVFRKISYAWTKIQKLFLNPFASKPYGALAECINELPEEFIDVLYEVFVDRKVSKLELEDLNEDNLTKLSDIIKTSITFFEFENEKITLTKKCGTFRKNMNVGYLPEDKVYVLAKALPKKNSSDEPEQKTLIKLSKISLDLFKMYQNDEIKLRNLDSVLSLGPTGSRPPGGRIGMHSTSKTIGSPRMMNSSYQAPPRVGSSSKMMNSTLERQGQMSGSLSKVSFRGNSMVMSTSRV